MRSLTISKVKPPPKNEFVAALVAVGYTKNQRKLIHRAYQFSLYGHADQLRDDGSPYSDHPAWMAAYVVMELQILDFELVISILIHDLSEDQEILSFSSIYDNFGLGIAECNAALTKDKNHSDPMGDSLARCLILKNWKAPFAKCVDRLHNSRTLRHCTLEKIKRKNQETKECFLDPHTGLIALMREQVPPMYHRHLDAIREELTALSLEYDQMIADERTSN